MLQKAVLRGTTTVRGAQTSLGLIREWRKRECPCRCSGCITYSMRVSVKKELSQKAKPFFTIQSLFLRSPMGSDWKNEILGFSLDRVRDSSIPEGLTAEPVLLHIAPPPQPRWFGPSISTPPGANPDLCLISGNYLMNLDCWGGANGVMVWEWFENGLRKRLLQPLAGIGLKCKVRKQGATNWWPWVMCWGYLKLVY